MAIDFVFNDDRKLQSLALVGIAKSLWGISAVQHQIHTYFSNKNKAAPRMQNWDKVTGDVLNYLKRVYLPPKIEMEIVNAIINVGERIFYWIEFLTEHLKVELAYAQRIYFTRHGTIDEKKIFNLFWANDPVLSKINNFNKGIFLLSCLYAQKDFINKNKDVMITLLKKTKKVPQSVFKKYEDKVDLLITASVIEYLQQFNLTKKEQKTVKQFKSKTDVVRPDAMYELCTAYGLFEASQYYFVKMGAVIFIVPMLTANACLKGIESLKEVNCYRRGKFSDMFICYLSIARPEDLNFFMTQHIGQCLQLLLIWPLQKFYYIFLEQVRDHLAEKNVTLETDFAFLIKAITDLIIEDNKAKLPVKTDVYRNILQRTWSIINESVKAMIWIKGASLKNVFEASDFSTLSLLIDMKNPPKDDDSEELNMRCWKIGDKIFNLLKEGDDFEWLSKFVKEAFNSDEDREIFKNDILLYYTMKIIIDGGIDKADKILNWMCQSKEDLPVLKNKLNQKRIVNSMISRKDFQLIGKFFDWLSFTPDQVDEFKKDLIKENENSVREFLTHLMCARFHHKGSHISIQESLNNFFKFVGAKPKEITEIKKKIIEDIHGWICYFAIETLGMDIAASLVYWVFDWGDKLEKAEEVIKNFLDSSDGVTLANEMIETLDCNPPGYVFKFINEWMPLARNLEDFKRRLVESKPEKIREIDRVFDAIESGGLNEDDVDYNSFSDDEIDCPKPKQKLPNLPFMSSDSSDEDLEEFLDMMGDISFFNKF